jgi:hypothetical protein
MYIPSDPDPDPSTELSTEIGSKECQATEPENRLDHDSASNNAQPHKLKPVNKRIQPTRRSARNATAAVKDIFELAESDKIVDDDEPEDDVELTAVAGATERSQGSAGEDHVEDADSDTSTEGVPDDSGRAKPPAIDWTELIVMALKSKHPTPMTTRKIKTYLMKTFPYFAKNPNGDWKMHVRQTLSRRKEFEKIGDEFAAQWALSGLIDDKTVPKRGRPRNGPAGPLKGVESKRKRGRPLKIDNERDLRKRHPGESKSSDPATNDGNEADTEPEASFAPWPAMSDSEEDELSAPMNAVLAASLRSSNRSKSSPQRLTTAAEAEGEVPLPAHAQNVSSDINREPESTPAQLPTARILRSMANLSSSSTSKGTPSLNKGMLPSSSPILTMKKPSAAVYSRTSTPGTGRSTLFGKPGHSRVHALRSSFSLSSPTYRCSSVPVPGSSKRVVHTPLRDGNDADDELA